MLFGVGAGNGVGGLLNAFNGRQQQPEGGGQPAGEGRTARDPAEPCERGRVGSARPGPLDLGGPGEQLRRHHGPVHRRRPKELATLTEAWQKYLTLTNKPDPNLAILAARAYGQLGNYAQEASAWEIQTLAQPTAAKGYMCLAAAAYAAKQTRKGDLAAAKALNLVPKASQAAVKLQLQGAKTSQTLAQSC